MVDPVTLGTLALGAAAGSGAAALSGGGGGVNLTTPAMPKPQNEPLGKKPDVKSQTPSFLAGASLLPGAGGSAGGGGATAPGKTLLGS